MDFKSYDPENFYDELFKSKGKPRPGTKILIDRLKSFPKGEILRRQKAAEAALFNMGVTFTVYSDESGIEKIFPFDILPRIIEPGDWKLIEKGLKQRIYALNLFIDDVYHDQKIIKDAVIPKDILYSSKCFQTQCIGLNPPKGIWCHITGTDLVRDRDGCFYVLEDNLRCPSGVSYVLENRQVLKRTFPLVFDQSDIRPVDDYPDRLLRMLQFLAPENVESPTIALLTPGIYNSAYFEHSFLAQQIGIELVEGNDLAVVDGHVYMRTTRGFQKVDVIYRRIDDDYLDPTAFNPDSLLGVPG
ncbi:MAG: circularly permuted type 2 ATP-grasp protein, partial [Thermodesulfobacteriota bacterium]